MSGASTYTKAERFAMAMTSVRREFDLVSADCDYFITRAKKLEAESAKLRELCADMYGFIKRMDEDCGDVTFSDCFDYCKHDTADDGCCKTGECWYEQRLRELGIEVGE